MSWNWQKTGAPFDEAANNFIERCKLDDASITLLRFCRKLDPKLLLLKSLW